MAVAGGAIHAARSAEHAVVAVCGRFALPALIRYDLKVVLGELAGARGGVSRRSARPARPGRAACRAWSRPLARRREARATRVVVRDRTGRPSVLDPDEDPVAEALVEAAEELISAAQRGSQGLTSAIAPKNPQIAGFTLGCAPGASGAAVSFAPIQPRPEGQGGVMTKSDFVDKVAAESGLSKKDAGTAVDAVLSTIEEDAQGWRRGLVHGLRQVPRRRARRPRGSQPAHGRDDDHRRQQGSALHRRLRPQEGRQVAGAARTGAGDAGVPGVGAGRDARPAAPRPVRRPPGGRRRRARVADRRRGRPRPRQLWPAATERRPRRASLARARGQR